MNICCCINEKFLHPVKVLLYSLFETQHEEIDFYLLNIQLCNESIEEIKKFCEPLNINFHYIQFPETLLKRIHEIVHENLTPDAIPFYFSSDCYLRLFIPLLFPISIHRVLYLDSDILIRKDLSDFYHTNFDENEEVAGVPDPMEIATEFKKGLEERRKLLEFSENNFYINSGVLLMNLDKMRKNIDFSEQKLFEYINRFKNFYDQDIINFILRGKIKKADLAFNMHSSFFSINAIRKAVIIHYMGSKPWTAEPYALWPDVKINYEAVAWWKRAEKTTKVIENLLKKY